MFGCPLPSTTGESEGEQPSSATRVAQVKPTGFPRVATILSIAWIVLCVGFFAIEAGSYRSAAYPEALRSILTANYLE